MNWMVWPLIVVSACGLCSSSAIHLYARLGTLTNIGQWESVLGVGIFAVGIPGFLVSGLQDKSVTLKQYWGRVVAVLGTCPTWLRYLIIVAFLYGSFCAWTSVDLSFGQSTATDLETRRLVRMSGVFMAFYAISLAMLYSATDEKFRERLVESKKQ